MTDLHGRTVMVTGANTGIGKETARGLAQRGARVVLAGRSEDKHRTAMADIEASVPGADLDFLQLDLSDLDRVRTAATTWLQRDEPLHVLVNNAGMGGARGLTPQGFELTFGTNYVGPWLLTSLLTDRLVASGPGARIVNVASMMHARAKGIDWDAVRRPTSVTGIPEYNVSKLANILHAVELGRRLAGTGVTTYSLHPGAIASDVYREVPPGLRHVMKLFMLSPEKGARTSLYCATSPDVANETGRYYDNCREKRPARVVTDDLARELWERTEAWLG